MNTIYPELIFTKNSFWLSRKPIQVVFQVILFFGLVWLLAGCGNQDPSVAIATATVTVATSLPPEPTATPANTPTTEPTSPHPPTQEPITTPTPIPTPEIDSEAQNFYYKGLTYATAGLMKEASASFDQAIALQADYALAYLERGKLYMEQAQLGQAKSDFQYALEFTTDPAVKGEIKSLLQQLATVPTATPILQADKATPTPEVTVVIASGPPIEAQLGQPVSLPLGGTAHFEEANLSVVFQSVLEDSRCPRDIECFWSGQARIMIQAQQGETAATAFELNNNPPLKQDTISYAGCDIHLVQLDPYPETSDQPIPAEAYQATFVVSAK
jgi:tetratricopeptide (TPR) repeat protein